jgi:hypothetical protein
MAETKTKTDSWLGIFSELEHHWQPLAPRGLFARRLARNVGLALGLILISLAIGILGYRYFEGLDWSRSFGHAAMILGGMGPYGEPKNESSEVFEGVYALYAGLVLVGVTGLILTPVFHRVMHQLHLPDGESTEPAKPKPQPKRSSSAKRDSA